MWYLIVSIPDLCTLTYFKQGFSIVSVNMLDISSGAKSSYVSNDGKNESLLDHIIIPSDKLDLV